MSPFTRPLLGSLAAAVAVGCAASPPVPDGEQPAPSVTTSPGGLATSAPEPDAGPVAHRLLDSVPSLHPSVDNFGHDEVVLRAPDGSLWTLPVLVARSSAERQHGLMEVADLPDGTGMAFLFEADRTGGFWMSGTLIELDIVYVDAQGAPVTITTMVPCTQDPCPTYPPDDSYRNTLEVPGGFFGRIGFDLDWNVSFPPF